MSRSEAEDKLASKEGLFLIRESVNFPGDYTLCICAGDKVEHYHIIYSHNKLTIDEEVFFENLTQLVEVQSTRKSLLVHHKSCLIFR